MLSRRQTIKGLTLGAGASLLSPLLGRLAAQASGAAIPRRFVFVVQSNGIDPNHVIPVGLPRRKDKELPDITKAVSTPLAGLDLPDPIAPLAPLKHRLTIVRGLSGRMAEGGTGGHSTNHGALGCYPGSAGPLQQTIDHALGEATPAVYQQVGLGVLSKADQTLNYQISASAPGKASPIQCSPEQAFNSLFGSVTGGGNRNAFDRRTHLLDFMSGDLRRARSALAAPEREKLDQYLSAFESLHARQASIDTLQGVMRAHLPDLDEEFKTPHEVHRLRAQFETGTAALLCGLTNVLTLTSGGGGQNYLSFPDLGIPIDGHEIGHGKGVNGLTSEQCFVKVRQHHCTLIAEMARRLDSIREGDGTVLDNTLIVYLSDSGEAHHPNLKEWPVLLLGGLAGRVQQGGRYLQLPDYQKTGHRTLANFYLTLLEAMEKPRASFGTQDPGLRDIDTKGLVPELLV
jgi:hypothetical protein